MMRIWIVLAALVAADLSGQSTPQAIHYYNPAWSPDGRTLAFEVDSAGRGAVYRVNVDGTDLRRLTPDGVSDAQPSWSPDGRRLVFSSNAAGVEGLHLMNADGTGRTPLLRGSSSPGFAATFSPDGEWIAFGHQLRPRSNLYAIGVARTDGSNRRILTDSTTESTGPAWSLDGTRLIFWRTPQLALLPGLSREEVQRQIAKRDSMAELFSIALDGSGLIQITKDSTRDCCIRRSASGPTIYFRSGRDGAMAVFAMSRDGSIRRTDLPDPNVSPDGHWVAYSKDGNGAAGIYVYEIATKRERRVTPSNPPGPR